VIFAGTGGKVCGAAFVGDCNVFIVTGISVKPHTATHCNTLQHSASHCSTPGISANSPSHPGTHKHPHPPPRPSSMCHRASPTTRTHAARCTAHTTCVSTATSVCTATRVPHALYCGLYHHLPPPSSSSSSSFVFSFTLCIT